MRGNYAFFDLIIENNQKLRAAAQNVVFRGVFEAITNFHFVCLGFIRFQSDGVVGFDPFPTWIYQIVANVGNLVWLPGFHHHG